MKLILYDVKHQQILAEKDMGEINESSIAIVNSTIEFLNDNLVFNDYVNLTLAESAEVIYIDDEPQVVLRGVV